jgi:uncharacterized protein
MTARDTWPHPVAPTPDAERIHALDALRGIALLGILWANVRQLLHPWAVGNYPLALGGSERMAWLDWQVFHALVDLKFITLFSLLFGVSFALQSERLTARGGHFTAVYLRRVAILGVFGIAHALFLYPAEVLFPYAIAGLLLLACRRFSPANLIRVGLVLLGLTLVFHYLLDALAFAGAADEYRSAQRQLAAMLTDASSAWPEEFRVRREGGFGALVILHAQQYLDVLIYFAILMLWRTLALFMIGAGIYRSGVLTRATAQTWRRVATIGLSIGLVLSIAATWLHSREMLGHFHWRWPELVHTLSSLPLAAGIAGAVFVMHGNGTARWLWTRIEAAGRMALTNYIGQSLTMAAIAESWGLGLYGKLSGVQLTLLAIGVFALLATLSEIWLRRYRMGPLEWLWRCGTYGAWLPNRISRDSRKSAPAGTTEPSRTQAPR